MIKIVAIDRVKEKSIKDAIDIYLKRLVNRLRIDIIEISPVKYNTFDDIEKAKNIESEKILNLIKGSSKNSLLIALDEKGSQLTSIEFCNLIYETINQRHLTFIIGGAYGLAEQIIQKVDIVVSVSKMTFTHEMVRLFLVEQIYRAYTINNNISYHN